MLPIQMIMTVSATVALSAGVPQMVKLVKTKRANDLNLSTWMMWVVTQSVSTAYAFSINDKLLMTINLAWVTFYATMTFLIIRYSRKARKEIISAVSIETPNDEQLPAEARLK